MIPLLIFGYVLAGAITAAFFRGAFASWGDSDAERGADIVAIVALWPFVALLGLVYALLTLIGRATR